jgi:hypothetical protein
MYNFVIFFSFFSIFLFWDGVWLFKPQILLLCAQW